MLHQKHSLFLRSVLLSVCWDWKLWGEWRVKWWEASRWSALSMIMKFLRFILQICPKSKQWLDTRGKVFFFLILVSERWRATLSRVALETPCFFSFVPWVVGLAKSVGGGGPWGDSKSCRGTWHGSLRRLWQRRVLALLRETGLERVPGRRRRRAARQRQNTPVHAGRREYVSAGQELLRHRPGRHQALHAEDRRRLDVGGLCQRVYLYYGLFNANWCSGSLNAR